MSAGPRAFRGGLPAPPAPFSSQHLSNGGPYDHDAHRPRLHRLQTCRTRGDRPRARARHPLPERIGTVRAFSWRAEPAPRGPPSKLLTEAAEADERLTAAGLLKDLRDLQRTARRIGKKAEKDGDLPTALRAVAELRGLLVVGLKGLETVELEARLDALEEALPDSPKKIA